MMNQIKKVEFHYVFKKMKICKNLLSFRWKKKKKSSILDNSEENHVHTGHDIRSIFLST
jgi:hypothetical protein